MYKIKKILVRNLITITFLFTPAFSFAAGLVPCDNSAGHTCDFAQLMNLVNKIINFILVDLAVPIAAIMFFYAGFTMVTSGGSAESRSKAKGVFTNTALGLIFVAGAWLIIKTLLSILGFDGAWIGL